ncbi:MAG: OapB/ArvB family protein [Nanobdellota archaeon]
MITLQIVPYSEIEHLSSVGRIRKLLTISKEDKIVLLQGRLRKDEEKELIKATMEEINADFTGIEIATIDPNDTSSMFRKMLSNLLLGDRQGMTIIGPASVVKEIKKDPSKIELLTQEKKKK